MGVPANAAVVQLTRNAALELGGCGVRVNCICRDDAGASAEHAAAAVAWLASEAGRRANGWVLLI